MQRRAFPRCIWSKACTARCPPHPGQYRLVVVKNRHLGKKETSAGGHTNSAPAYNAATTVASK